MRGKRNGSRKMVLLCYPRTYCKRVWPFPPQTDGHVVQRVIPGTPTMPQYILSQRSLNETSNAPLTFLASDPKTIKTELCVNLLSNQGELATKDFF